MRGDRLERDHQHFFRVYYDAWVVRNINGPGKPGEWVKELRHEDLDSASEAHRIGQLYAEGSLPDRPVGFFVAIVDITEMVVIERGVG